MTANAASAQPLPRAFGSYELLEEIGSGGMGVIYRARQPGLDRLCAIKMLRPGVAGSPANEEQLREEAKAAASLDHPNIVGIYEVGQVDGQLYFSMELVDGKNLAQFVRDEVLSAERIANYGKRIAEAVHYAHSRGVLHCDLKPANILLDVRDDPQITDFGLSRRTNRRTARQSASADGAGSPNFMAPEQASARFGEPGVATDVFGIGATLYFLLTDRPPFQGETCADTIRAVLEQDPVRPRLFRPGIPIDLETICLKCCEKRPTKRYRNAREIADELGRFLNDEPIQARQISIWERLWRWVRRHPWIGGLSAATTILLMLVAIGSPIIAYRLNQARQDALNSEAATRQSLYAADMTLAFQALTAGRDDQVRELLERHRPKAGKPDLRGWEWRFLWSQSRPDSLGLVGQQASAIASTVSLDAGRKLLASDNSYHLKTWDLAVDGRQLDDRQPHAASAVVIATDPRCEFVALTDRPPQATNNVVRVLRLADWSTNCQFEADGYAVPRSFGPDGATVWLAGDSSVEAYSVSEGRRLLRFPSSDANPQRVMTLSPDGRVFARGTASGMVVGQDARSGEEVFRFADHRLNPPFSQAVLSLQFSPDGRWLASGAGDGAVRVYDWRSKRQWAVFQGHPDLVLCIAFSPDSRLLASGGRDSFLKVWDVPGRQPVAALRSGASLLLSAHFSVDGQRIYTGGEDGAIRRWPVREPNRFPAFTNFPTGYAVAAFTSDGAHFSWSASTETTGDGGVQPLFSTNDLFRIQGDTNRLAAAFVAPRADRGMVAFYHYGGAVETVSFPEGRREMVQLKPWATLPPTGSAVLEFSADGRQIVVGDPYNGLRILKAADLSVTRHFTGHRFVGAVFSPDGRRFGAVTIGGPAIVGDIASGSEIELEAPTAHMQTIAFNADGRELASATLDGKVYVFDTATGRRVHNFRSPAGVISLGFSPDQSRLAAGGIDGWICFWDLRAEREIGVYAAHKGAVGGVRFTPEGEFISLGSDGHRRWPSPPLAEIDELR